MTEQRPLKVLIADDEPLAAERLQMMLARIDSIHLVGTAHDGESAVRMAEALAPDLVLLDIAMPGLDGIEVARALSRQPVSPAVVFVTAYDEHALAAFEVHAFDYILKPVSRQRFAKAIDRVVGLIRADVPAADRPLEALIEAMRTERTALDRIAVKADGRVLFIRVNEIDWIEAAGNYVKLHVGSETHLFRETMNSVEAQLSPETFYRIHRCHIVNIERVKELQPWFNGEHVVVLQNGTRLTLSRGYREKLQEQLKRGF